jgi:hypothetical protein
MRYTTLFLLFFVGLLTACSTTVPVARKFPDVPPELLETCAELTKVKKEETKLSQILVVVTENYSKYHECKIKNDAWIEWYTEQKKIFDSVK